MAESSLSVLRDEESETGIGPAPAIPEEQLPPEPIPPDAKPATRSRTRSTRKTSRKRSIRTRVSELRGRPAEPAGSAPERDQDAEPLSEQEVVRAFWWFYKFWCKFLGAPVEAQREDFYDLGEAWVGLGRKVPGIKLLLAAIAPAVATFQFLDLLQEAWDRRTRHRRQRAGSETEAASVQQPLQPEQPSTQPVRGFDGGPAAG